MCDNKKWLPFLTGGNYRLCPWDKDNFNGNGQLYASSTKKSEASADKTSIVLSSHSISDNRESTGGHLANDYSRSRYDKTPSQTVPCLSPIPHHVYFVKERMTDDTNNINPDMNKFEVDNKIIQTLMTELASRIQSTLPGAMRFSLFLFQEVPEQQEANIFYCSTLSTPESLPLIETWCRRQVQ